jgi:gliding motility-associated-like protein
MPNAFTPNGDGKNDVFRIPPGTSLQLKEFSIYDEWGTKVFST